MKDTQIQNTLEFLSRSHRSPEEVAVHLDCVKALIAMKVELDKEKESKKE